MRQTDGDTIEIKKRYGGIVSSNVRTVFSRNDSHLDVVDLPPQSLQDDQSVQDPVNDTGLGPRGGDLQSLPVS